MMKIDKKLSARYMAIADETVALEMADALRSGNSDDDEVTSKPRLPAKEADILAAEKKRKRVFSDEYRTFLLTMNGWEDFSWGTHLYGTRELRSNDRYDDDWEVFTYGDEPLPKELDEALLIGASENDASRILLLKSGEASEISSNT